MREIIAIRRLKVHTITVDLIQYHTIILGQCAILCTIGHPSTSVI